MKKSDSVRTPEFILTKIRSEFGELYDPCPYNPKFDSQKNKDGLTTEWGKVSFVNPPYSFVRPWFRKAREQWLSGKTVILFVKLLNLGTQYARNSITGAEVRILSNKIQFPGYSGAAQFNNVLVIFRAGLHSTNYSII